MWLNLTYAWFGDEVHSCFFFWTFGHYRPSHCSIGRYGFLLLGWSESNGIDGVLTLSATAVMGPTCRGPIGQTLEYISLFCTCCLSSPSSPCLFSALTVMARRRRSPCLLSTPLPLLAPPGVPYLAPQSPPSPYSISLCHLSVVHHAGIACSTPLTSEGRGKEERDDFGDIISRIL
jgi:hypothetical protein